jgi:twitching motility protein PilT
MDNKEQLHRYLHVLIKNDGSDLHIKSGSKIHIRKDGEMFPISQYPLSNKDVELLARAILTDKQYAILQTEKEFDRSYSIDNVARFRTNFFYQFNGLSMIMRRISSHVPTLQDLRLPEMLKEMITTAHKGMLLITGATGSGKSTTAAALIDIINRHYRRHIITIEDPIEYLFTEEKSLISQRAIGENSLSYDRALKAAFREDFDVLFVGEIRNLETLKIAMHAANTGHLLISTMHTKGSVETVARIINLFPPEEHQQIRLSLAQTLIGIVSQQLVKGIDGKLLPAVEILKNTGRISELITSSRDAEILDAVAKNHKTYGMQTLDQSLLGWYNQGKITQEELLGAAHSPSDMQLKISGVQ